MQGLRYKVSGISVYAVAYTLFVSTRKKVTNLIPYTLIPYTSKTFEPFASFTVLEAS